MNLNANNWKPFKLSALFDIKKGKRLTKFNQTEGHTPYIGAIDSNNGVSGYIGQAPIHEGGTISVNYDGSVAEAFYQPEPYWASDAVNVLYPNGFMLTMATATFICTVIRLEKFRFNYGRKWHLERMRESVIKLPVTFSGEPDWEFMDSVINQLPVAELVAFSTSGLAAPDATPLDTSTWKPFKYTDLFDIVRGQGPSLAEAKDNPGAVPYVTASDKNNGVSAMTALGARHPGCCLSVAIDGSVGETFFQPLPFCANTAVVALIPKRHMTREAMLFMAALIRREGKFKYGYGRKWGLGRMKDSELRLPIADGGLPDWAYMQKVVQALPSQALLTGVSS